MITLTDRAVQEVKKFMKEFPDAEDHCLLVSAAAGGCSGFNYKIEFIHKNSYSDVVYNKYEQNEVTVLVNKKTDIFIDGTTIDWHQDLMKSGFVFNNPNATKTCGCGESFSV